MSRKCSYFVGFALINRATAYQNTEQKENSATNFNAVNTQQFINYECSKITTIN